MTDGPRYEPTEEVPLSSGHDGCMSGLLGDLASGQARAALAFAGQASPWLDTMRGLWADRPVVRPYLRAAAEQLAVSTAERELAWSGHYDRGVDLLGWIGGDPVDALYAASSPISQPMIFAAQVCQFVASWWDGLSAAFDADAVVAATGHSQGVMAAALVAESRSGDIAVDRFRAYLEVMIWQGHFMQRSQGPVRDIELMAAISGLSRDRLAALVDRACARVAPEDRPVISLENTRLRHVVSGTPAALDRVRLALEDSGLDHTYDRLPITFAAHSPRMQPGLEWMLPRLDELGFRVEAPRIALVSPVTGEPMSDRPTHDLVRAQFVEPVRWRLAASVLADRSDVVLDFGPGDGVAKLSASAIRGRGASVLALATPAGRAALTEPPEPVLDYRRFLPKLAELSDGAVVVDNRFSRATGMPPVLLPGMTPTTGDAPIVAAAANGGFVAELAGGSQVTAEILEHRLEELAERLEPGRQVVFNALFLDPYLWKLHFGSGLVQRLTKRGAPLCGVTVSAGIPDTDDAVALLEELEEAGLWLNAFKPGTRAQVDAVLEIAARDPQRVLFVHLEGGKAGGHHSWEDLDGLLLDTYARVRRHDNVVLCVGGGIGDEERAVALLTGRWSEAYGEPAMPVDAVFLGTLAMATAEAMTSPAVKQALVDAEGTDRWLRDGASDGGVTSGRSSLDADLHTLDNGAARVSRLLEEVAGDADAVAARRDAIVEALAGTAKPYFGDVEEMTYLGVLWRMIELMATGSGSPYEDGVWPDKSFRARVLDFMRRAEARLCEAEEGTVPSVVYATSLDEPDAALATLLAAYPGLATTTVHPSDAHHFVREICARPGKPVPFVPVIDGDVRRWYASDSLWQSHDPRFPAEAVMVIPGPEAVRGITRVDEPVADLLGRFHDAVVADLQSAEVESVRRERLPPVRQHRLPSDVQRRHRHDGLALRAMPGCTSSWMGWLGGFDAAVAHAVSAPLVFVGSSSRPNPLRRLFSCVPGAVLELDEAQGRIVCATWRMGGELVVVEETARSADGAVLRATVHPEHAATVSFELRVHGRQVHLDQAGLADSVAEFYRATMLPDGGMTPLFGVARWRGPLDLDRVRAYGSLTGHPDGVPANYAFCIAWPALFQALATREIAGGLLDLVHLDHEVRQVAAIDSDVDVVAEARITRVEDGPTGRVVAAEAQLLQGAGLCATVRGRFFVRGAFSSRVRAVERLERTVTLDETLAAFLRDHDQVALDTPVCAGDTLTLTADLRDDSAPTEQSTGRGALARGGVVIGSLGGDPVAAAAHPLRALLDTIAPEGDDAVVVAGRTLGTCQVRAPAHMGAFADVGGDHNPIHTSGAMARLAGLDGPIVHGMWTAARVHGWVVEALAGGDASRVDAYEASFTAPVLPGTTLTFTARRTAAESGHTRVEVAVDAEGTAVMSAVVRLAAPRTAYVFPGQGVQRKGMGMDGYGRSAAARRVWDRADAVTRDRLGFSVLRVVRDNPGELRIGDELLRHRDGVLHLTQFTQVAMAVHAAAQVAELRAAGVYDEDAIACGHSVGEYNALAAAFEVLPLEAVVPLVYERGLAMHGLVPRDEAGNSDYGMGVIRPHKVGLSEADALALVEEVAAETGAFLAVVNHNVKGRQYAVTGRRKALTALAARLGSKAWVLVPGIDVPFHSSELRGAVDRLRTSLRTHLPVTLPADRLVGRYIPNLVPRLFTLDRAFVEEVADTTGSEVLAEALAAGWTGEPDVLARLLVIELLAYQFASPVRWVETQDLLFAPAWAGGCDVQRLVEVGVGGQPTLANMASYTLSMGASGPVEVLNTGRDAERVYLRDADVIVSEPEEELTDASTAEAAPAPAPTPAMAPAPSGAPLPTGPVTTMEAVTTLLALQAKVRRDQVDPRTSIEELVSGVSSRVNQALLDLRAEFDLSAFDGAQQMPIADLAERIEAEVRYKAPGAYLRASQDEAIRAALGGTSRAEAGRYLKQRWGLDDGLVGLSMCALALGIRDGRSARGGALVDEVLAPASNKRGAQAVLDAVARRAAAWRGHELAEPATAQTEAAVDPAAVRALEERLLGPEGALVRAAQVLADAAGHTVVAAVDAEEAASPAPEASWSTPRFDVAKHVAMTSAWAWAQRDVAKLAFSTQLDPAQMSAEAGRLAAFAGDPRVADTARWFARQATGPKAEALTRISAGQGGGCGPSAEFVEAVSTDGSAQVPGFPGLFDALRVGLDNGLDFRGRTAVVTGAGPTGIARVIVEHLLRGGARVVVTTSSYGTERLKLYRRLYQRHAGPGAELHVVGFNQASRDDVEAFVQWLFEPVREASGGSVKELKPAFYPDILVPFAALGDAATLDTLGDRADATVQAMLLNVERLIGGIAAEYRQRGMNGRCHVLLPLSPNHGTFGGDGAYAETKAALEVLATKWVSEHASWGRYTTLCPATIGWVRGTGLMAGNDAVADGLEGVRTFSSAEMGYLLAGLCLDGARAAAAQVPLHADLSGGLGAVADLRSVVAGIRAGQEADRALAEGLASLRSMEQELLGVEDVVEPALVGALPSWRPEEHVAPGRDWAHQDLSDMVVIVGMGEVGPYGNARCRFEVESTGRLSAAAVVELAWTMGLVAFERGGWVDVASGEPVEEAAIAGRYRDQVVGHTGVRWMEPEQVGFDPERVPVFATVVLERDMTFGVANEADARAFVSADPEHTSLAWDPQAETWKVTRRAGARIRVPREARLSRRVAGQLPSGFDPARFGVPPDMAERTDRLALYNLIATVDAFVSAGMEPEELMQRLHPARVANTQGAGIGGVQALSRLYRDHLLGEERQNDVLQEALINVTAAYAVSRYVGSYGSMTHPAAACATAAVSLGDGVDKILAGKADFVVTGGFDDLGEAGTVGFADLNATADCDAMVARGLEPHQMSRPCDRRRGGFVGAQGGGTLLLTRGDIALALGLPVQAVVGWAGSFSDGVHRSIPAPGMGPLAAACGGRHSPLGRTLARFGRTADDIGLVYKHDTSTNANDPNESELHHRIAEALGRTPGNPLFAVSQKWLTGHAKGGAAAWQAIGLIQAMHAGVVPGNRNLEDVDGALRPFSTVAYTDESLQAPEGFTAGLLTSLGFGHVGAIVLLFHPEAFEAQLGESERSAWRRRVAERSARSARHRAEVLRGERSHFDPRDERRFDAGDGTVCQREAEAALLLDPGARLDVTGTYG